MSVAELLKKLKVEEAYPLFIMEIRDKMTKEKRLYSVIQIMLKLKSLF